MTERGFVEVAERVYVLRYPVLDVNVTLIAGDDVAMVVDTLSTPGQARSLADAVRRITSAPVVVVNTHHHFDHCFGNATLNPIAIYAHPETAARLAATDPRRVYQEWGSHDPEFAGLGEVEVRGPDRLVRDEAQVDVGGRTVVLRYLGRGHTAGDLVVHVPDAGLVIAGDLVEESGPPSFEDAYPLEWPESLAALLALDATTVVPGHGALVDAGFVHGQHADLAALDWLIRDGHADGAPRHSVVAKAPYPVETATVAVARGYAELAGTA
jgi:glyoxylase-like metal-dependent hydrolase (beta-lactamase superfamily II)